MGAQKKSWFQQTMREQQGKLIRYTKKILRDEAQSQDIVQEVFIRLWKQDYPESEKLVPPWLYCVCRNLAIDHYRWSSKLVDGENIEDSFELMGSEEEKLMNSQVYYAFAQLPKKNQEVMILMFQEGLTYKEIAHAMDLTISYVGVIIHQSIKTLRVVLREEEFFYETK